MNNISELDSKRMKGNSIKKILPLAIIICCFVAFFIFDLARFVSFEALSENRDSLVYFVESHYLAAVSLYFVFYILSVAASFPGGLLTTLTGGFLFGWIVAGSVTVFAATIGATILFVIAATALGLL